MRHILMAYAESDSLERWRFVIEDEIKQFIERACWPESRCWCVSQAAGREVGAEAVEEVGLNLAIDLTEADWQTYVLPAVSMLKALSEATGSVFVVALHDSQTQLNEDVAEIGPGFMTQDLHAFVFGAA